MLSLVISGRVPLATAGQRRHEEKRGPARYIVMSVSERDLIRRCQEGATAAFEPLVRMHQGPSLGYAAAMLGDEDEAADALQDAFVQAFRALPRLRAGSPFGPWFRTILRNICLDRLRAPRRRRRVALEARSLDQAMWIEPVAQRTAERAALGGILAEAMQTLPEEQRVVLLLREIEGMSYTEIAGTVGVPAGTVASRLNHARAALRRALVARGIGLEELT
jgi:RNA polymerase sigma-70 factor, ECF subfamily